jgi:PAS domain S-box-containing protein
VKVSSSFLALVIVTVAAGVLAYLIVQWAHLPGEIILLVTGIAALFQGLLSVYFSRQLDADRRAALKLVEKICKEKSAVRTDLSFSNLMGYLEELIRETLHRERKVIENAADVICLVSTDGIILSANAAAKPVFGYTPEELIGTKLSNYYVAASKDDSLYPLLGAKESIQKMTLENQVRKKDGTVIDVLWSAHWSAKDNGLFCVAHDITKRKRTEILLKLSEERLRLILQNLPAGVCVLSLSGQCQFINETTRQLCSIAQEPEALLQAGSIFKHCPDPFTIDQFMKEMAASRESTILTASGEELPVEISVRTIDWENQPACLVMFVDVSEKRAAEKARQQFLAARDESLALRQKLMDMVAHDIRSPLASLLSTQQILLAGIGVTLEEKVRTRIEICQDEVQRLIRLINDLLKISRYEATRADLNLVETDMEKLIEQAVSSVQDLAMEKSISLITQTVSSSVMVDRDQILRVIFNLLSNAIKFSPPGKPIMVGLATEPSCLRVSVSDEGKGIPEGSEISIFLPYSQLSWQDSVRKGGTGLGLSICKEIVAQHGGSIGVFNNESGGASFWFTIPVK